MVIVEFVTERPAPCWALLFLMRTVSKTHKARPAHDKPPPSLLSFVPVVSSFVALLSTMDTPDNVHTARAPWQERPPPTESKVSLPSEYGTASLPCSCPPSMVILEFDTYIPPPRCELQFLITVLINSTELRFSAKRAPPILRLDAWANTPVRMQETTTILPCVTTIALPVSTETVLLIKCRLFNVSIAFDSTLKWGPGFFS